MEIAPGVYGSCFQKGYGLISVAEFDCSDVGDSRAHGGTKRWNQDEDSPSKFMLVAVLQWNLCEDLWCL